MYTDHEEGTYFAGDWLVRQVKRLWDTWDRHVYTSYLYQRPPRPTDLPRWYVL